MNRLFALIKMLGRLFLTLLILLLTLWGAMAMGYQLALPVLITAAFIIVWCLLGLLWLKRLWQRRTAWAVIGQTVSFVILLIWWNTLQPSNERIWSDDVAQITHGVIDGDQLTLHNVRHFDWRSDEDYDIHWETRQYDLNQLSSVDMTTSYWGMPAIAHVIVSFGFDDGRFLAFSVEIRKEKGESYSEIGGFFKQFELSVIAADERDVIRVRTNVRGEDDYLYRVRLPKQDIRALLIAYVRQTNELVDEPRFYNTFTTNCTTLVFQMMRHIINGLPLDYRLLLTGYLPSYVESVGGLEPGHSLDELKRRGRITNRAKAANDSPKFSRLIRLDVPGWETLEKSWYQHPVDESVLILP